MSLFKKASAEFTGTLFLVLFGCGVAVLSGVDLVATALAFGLVLLVLIYTIGPVSGCHVNPAVSLGMAINKRITWKEFLFYVIAQMIGAIAGAGLLYAIVVLNGAHAPLVNLGQNGFTPGIAGTWMALISEVVLTFVFITVIMAVTSKKNGAGKKAGVVIGLALVLVHLLGIDLTGTSVNPARSFGPALLVMGLAIEQVWVFLVAPLIGGILAAVFSKFFLGTEKPEEKVIDTTK